MKKEKTQADIVHTMRTRIKLEDYGLENVLFQEFHTPNYYL